MKLSSGHRKVHGVGKILKLPVNPRSSCPKKCSLGKGNVSGIQGILRELFVFKVPVSSKLRGVL
jgi:hypothetical protein